jgi:rhodanese-related sulfurtransferase
MDNLEFETLTADEFSAYLKNRKEKEYLIIDVRQESEYKLGHLPGARLMPLAEVEARLFSLPADRDLIFYCHNGGRSQWAASLAGEGEVSEKKIYHLMGGLLAWDGTTLPGFPKVQIFDKDREPIQLLTTAMDLEKGAWQFYQHAMDRFSDNPIHRILEQIAIAEKGHARLIYHFRQKFEKNPPPFDELYQNLKGEILEGGQNLADTRRNLDELVNRNCTAVIDLAPPR